MNGSKIAFCVDKRVWCLLEEGEWGGGGEGLLRALVYFVHSTRPEENKKTTRSPRRKRREFQVHSFDRFRAWVPLRCYAGMEPNSSNAGFDILQTNLSLL